MSFEVLFFIHPATNHPTSIETGLNLINLEENVLDKHNLISFLDGPVSVFGVLNEVLMQSSQNDTF
jgi:hypothetical protein